MLELIVFENSELAARAGFNTKTRRHRQDDNIRYWCAGMGEEALHGLVLSRVTVTDCAAIAAIEQGGVAHEKFWRAMHYLRGQLRDEPMIWMDL